jgi:hypothetical protein
MIKPAGLNRILIVLFLTISQIVSVNAQPQVPQGINYQTIIRNKTGKPVPNSDAIINVSIFSGAQANVLEWKEFHNIKTNNYGLVSIVIGTGTNTFQGKAESFSSVSWGNGNLFFQVSINYGQGEIDLGLVKLQSVPFALVSQKALSIDPKQETDPMFKASVASSIKTSDTAKWNMRSGFDGNYISLGNKPKLTDSVNWNKAYNWGNHATQGYIKSYTETDPLFVVSAAKAITANDISIWNAKSNFSGKYGDLTGLPNLSSFISSETDPLFSTWNKSTGISITSLQVTDFQSSVTNNAAVAANTAKISYPAADATKLAGISAGAEVNVNADWTATSGDAEILNKPTFSHVAFTGNYNDLASKPTGISADWNFLTNNPFVYSTPNDGQLHKYNSTSGKWENWTPNYLTSFNETDPVFSTWNKRTGITITASQVSNFDASVSSNTAVAANTAKISYPTDDATKLAGIAIGAEVNVNADWNANNGDAKILNKPITIAGYGITDAMTTTHAANIITSTNINNWNIAFGWGNHAGLYRLENWLPKWTDVVDRPTKLSDFSNDLAGFSGKWAEITGKPTTILDFGIIDAMTTAHAANNITNTNISNWDIAYGWGNHTGLYRLIDWVPSWSQITSNPFVFTAVANNQILRYNATLGKWENWTPNYLTSLNETDPIYAAWDKSTGISIPASQVSDFAASVSSNSAVAANTAKISYPTDDATKLAGIAIGAEVNVNADWNASSGDAQIFNKPTTIAGYGITDALSKTINNSNILVGNTSNQATAVSLSGDANLSNTGAITITKLTGVSNKVTTGSDFAFTLEKTNHTTAAGTDFIIKGQTASGTNQNGGDLKLQPGAKTGTGADGKVQVEGNLKVTGAIYGDDNGNVIIQLGN